MTATKKTRKERFRPDASKAEGSTVIWGEDAEKDDFIKIPRTLLYLGRLDEELATKLAPRHHLLVMLLAAKKFQRKPIRAYWAELAADLGIKPATVRKWGYELRDLGLLTIKQHRGRDKETNKPGIRNERNEFSLAPLVNLLEKAFARRRKERRDREKRRQAKERT